MEAICCANALTDLQALVFDNLNILAKLLQLGMKGTQVVDVIGSLASLLTPSNPMLRTATMTASPLVWSIRRSGALMPSEGVEVAGLPAGPSSITMRSSTASKR